MSESGSLRDQAGVRLALALIHRRIAALEVHALRAVPAVLRRVRQLRVAVVHVTTLLPH